MRPVIVYGLPSAVDHSVATQRYFLIALESVANVHVVGEPLVTRPLRRVEDKLGLVYRASLLRKRSRIPFLATRVDSGLTGRYVAELDGRRVTFAIDARDQPEIFDEDVFAECDVYFKANRWPTRTYETKVMPLINGNGFLTSRRIVQLRELRRREKDVDVAFVANVWGGREHMVRLFEELAKLPGRHVLRAVFPSGFGAAETARFRGRLEAVGVVTSDHQMPLDELWETMARARVVFFRAGKYLCLPWRTLEVLGMGACVAMDAAPFPQWYVPLRSDVNFVDCGIERPEDTTPAPAEQYERVTATVSRLLGDVDRMEAVRRANADYYDLHAAPAPLGAHILDRLRDASTR